MNTVLRVIWTAAILALVVFVSRSAPSGADVSAEHMRCEIDPPSDIAALHACVERSPRDVEILLDLAAAYEAAGRADEARQYYQKASAIDPADEALRR